MSGFKEFLLRGNLIDLAIAFILGASFGGVVESFSQLIMDVLGLVGGNPDFSSVAVGGINVGVFITALVSFVITAAILYFGIVKPYNAIRKLTEKKSEEAADSPSTEDLLAEIRDLLKDRQA